MGHRFLHMLSYQKYWVACLYTQTNPHFAGSTASALLGRLTARFGSVFMGIFDHSSKSTFIKSGTDVGWKGHAPKRSGTSHPMWPQSNREPSCRAKADFEIGLKLNIQNYGNQGDNLKVISKTNDWQKYSGLLAKIYPQGTTSFWLLRLLLTAFFSEDSQLASAEWTLVSSMKSEK